MKKLNRLQVINKGIKKVLTNPILIKSYKLTVNEPIKGDEKQFFGKWFVWSGSAWYLDEICKNVISPKNVETSGYPIHSYSM